MDSLLVILDRGGVVNSNDDIEEDGEDSGEIVKDDDAMIGPFGWSELDMEWVELLIVSWAVDVRDEAGDGAE